MKVAELEGAKLDYWVAKADQGGFEIGPESVPDLHDWWRPSTEWSQGGPIIEREGIQLEIGPSGWYGYTSGHAISVSGPTPLIAAMRCFVASKFGDEVPD